MAGGETSGGHLTLLGVWPSPFVIRARIALNLKGLPYRYAEEEDLFGNKSELLLSSNPVHKKVPVLIHGGKPVAESRIIVEYVDEVFPASGPRILPADPYDRAVARFWAAYVDDKLLSTWIQVYGGRTTEERAEAARQVVAVLETFERAFEECSRGEAFFGGERVGLVDVVLGGFVGWLRTSEEMCGVKIIDHAKTPLLAAWAERFCALDGVKEVIPDVQRLVEYNKMRRARLGLP
uniref:glutathione transferase n=1 Tax=Arundo donax TaxID=35708 RepID=A0A0A9CY26_ARUDO